MLALGTLYQRIAHTFVQWRTVRVYGVIIAINEMQAAPRGCRSRSCDDSFTRIANITHWRRHQSRERGCRDLEHLGSSGKGQALSGPRSAPRTDLGTLQSKETCARWGC